MENLFIISLTTSVIILLMLVISPLTDKRYCAHWRYVLWLILALRLVIPIRFEFEKAPITVTPPPAEATIVFRTQGVPLEYFPDNGYIEKGYASESSADYSPIITLNELIFFTWFCGTLLFIFYHLGVYFSFRIRIKPYLDEDIPGVYICSKISSPMMLGFFKPIILLPQINYSNEEKSIILKHELTHKKRGDIWYKLLLVIANAVHWFNPIVYIMVHRANRDLEYSCDDLVISGMDTDYKKNYALTILKSIRGNEK